MEEAVKRLKQDVFPAFLVLFSLVPFFIIGSILDVLLAHLYGRFGDSATAAIPLISQWTLDATAGYRFLAQEIMVCLWGVMVLFFLVNTLVSGDQAQRNTRFLQSFLFMWVLGLTVASLIALSCILPFDLMLDRLDGRGISVRMVRYILILEVVMMVFIPVVPGIWRKSKGRRRSPSRPGA